MTKERLRECCHLVNEIKDIKERINALEAKCEKKPNVITDMPKGGEPVDYYVKLADAVLKLRMLESELHCELVAVEEFIETIPDSMSRTVFRMRHFKNRSFEEIAYEIGYSKSAAKKKYYRYYKSLPEK